MYTTDLTNENIVWKTPSGKKIHWLIPRRSRRHPNFELRYVEIPPKCPEIQFCQTSART